MRTILELGKRSYIGILVLALIFAAACSSSPSTTPTPVQPNPSTPAPSTPSAVPSFTSTPAQSPSTKPSSAPSIEIITPSGGNKFGIGDLTIEVKVNNFTLVDKLGQPNVPGQGHIHYFMDVDPPTTPGQAAVTTPGTYAATSASAYTWHNVNSGQHKFTIELVNNDHTPLNPPVTNGFSILVIPEIGPPNLVIVSPRDGAIIPAGNIIVTAQATNFNLVDKLGQANAPREGHLHYFLDVDAPITPGKPAITASGTYAATASTTYTWPNIAPGLHTLSVELINNDHTPLDPPVVAKIKINVNGSTPSIVPTATGQAITINLTAQNRAFDKTSISVPAGATLTVNFNNKDVGIPHNFAVYQNISGGQVKPVFIGDTISGPATIVYHFTAPTAQGSYFFECDVHPQIMTGSFIVTP